MISRISFILLVLVTNFTSFGQSNLSELLKKYNTLEVPYISVKELAMPKTRAIILDAREPKEYDVSHLQKAIFVGFSTFNLAQTTLKLPDRDQMIVVYCSLGIRSETIAEKLQSAGYTNVYNLYGGIFEWKNEDFPVYNSDHKETENVHAFSKLWGKWLLKGVKVYE